MSNSTCSWSPWSEYSNIFQCRLNLQQKHSSVSFYYKITNTLITQLLHRELKLISAWFIYTSWQRKKLDCIQPLQKPHGVRSLSPATTSIGQLYYWPLRKEYPLELSGRSINNASWSRLLVRTSATVTPVIGWTTTVLDQHSLEQILQGNTNFNLKII